MGLGGVCADAARTTLGATSPILPPNLVQHGGLRQRDERDHDTHSPAQSDRGGGAAWHTPWHLCLSSNPVSDAARAGDSGKQRAGNLAVFKPEGCGGLFGPPDRLAVLIRDIAPQGC
jgi:hypothetical protein